MMSCPSWVQRKASEPRAAGGLTALACQTRGVPVSKRRPLSALPRMPRAAAHVIFPWLLCLGTIAVLVSDLRAAVPSPVRIVEADGTVEVMRGNSGTWDKAATEPPYNLLNPGDQLRTGARSRAAVMLSNQSVVRVGEAGQIQVLAAPKKKAGFSFIKGLFYFFHRDNPDELDLETPTVSAVVRGT